MVRQAMQWVVAISAVTVMVAPSVRPGRIAQHPPRAAG
jgi:hypothetical protein